MARLGKLDEYDEKEQNFESYLERFEHFVTANDIKEEKKLAVFLSVIGPRTYEVLKSLVVPAVPGDKSFEEVTVLLTKHYSPSCSVIAELCKFNKRAQEEQESVEDFIVALKHLARKCDFGLFLQDALRDRLVAGIRREETQLALFAEDSLTFEKACKIALDREQAARQTALLHAEGKEATLHAMAIRVQGTEKKLKLRKFKDVKRICEGCGKAHAASVCWYKNVQCHSCSQIGHLQKMCPSKCRELKTGNVVDCSDSDSELDVYHVINTVRSGYEVQPRKTQLIRLLRCLVGQSPCHLSGFQARKSLQISSFRYLNRPRPEQLPPALRTSQTLHLQPSCQFFVVVPVCDIPRTDTNPVHCSLWGAKRAGFPEPTLLNGYDVLKVCLVRA
ncbi:uncharacterized protein LOC119453999 [Dermacentor silvarum]|uniref:uncharacterized protein LOC119453999 n=1 Tax=Dermacentor silvarum TaxID=543639 RepID=UPI00210119DF|nr:uncharacterized protein LOC119453999 [Dermacentor silvarum]